MLVLSGLLAKMLGCHEYESHMTGLCLEWKENYGINMERFLFASYIWSLVLVLITVPVSIFVYSYMMFRAVKNR